MNKKVKIILGIVAVVVVIIAAFLFFSNSVISQKPKSHKDYSNVDINIVVKDKNELHALIEDIGVKEAMQMLVSQSNGGSKYDCHQQAHQIGRIGYATEKEKAFQACDASCHSGCYHGAMESFLAEKGTANLAADITAVCKNFETSFGNFECLHGVGHGVLALTDYDMPEALKECQKLADSFGQTSCYGGVFMENILTGQGLGASTKQDHSTSWVNQTDPYFPCDKIDQSYDVQYQCYQMQTSWMLTIASYNFDTVSKECLRAPNDNMRPVCFKSMGRDIAGNTLRNPEKILALCSKVPLENGYYDQCLVGALNVIVDFWGPGLKDQATALCKITSDSHKQICYQTLAQRLPGLFKEKSDQQKICATFEPAYQNLCQQNVSYNRSSN